MGKLRTINHPGIELQEIDMSGSAEQVGGCTTLVMGFFPQGESGKPVNPTTNSAVKSYFGTPETEAERYAYYACKTVFDNGGNLVAARIPYNNNSQYLTPAVKYSIEEFSTKHIKEYAANGTSYVTNMQTPNYLSSDSAKDNFYYAGDNVNGIGTYAKTVYTEKEFGGDAETTTNYFAISANNAPGDAENAEVTYYELSFNPFDVVGLYDGDFESFSVTARISDFVERPEEDIETVDTYEDVLEIPEAELDIGKVCRVSEPYSRTSMGYYLYGNFDANSCLKYTRVYDELNNNIPNTEEAKAAAAENFNLLDNDPIVYAWGSNSDEDKPADTVSFEDASQSGISVVRNESTDYSAWAITPPQGWSGDEYVVEWGTPEGASEEGWYFKNISIPGDDSEVVSTNAADVEVIWEYAENEIFTAARQDKYRLVYTNALGYARNRVVEGVKLLHNTATGTNWTCSVKDEGGVLSVLLNNTQNNGMYYVYDRSRRVYRPFYDYYEDVSAQWAAYLPTKYDSFTFSTWSSNGLFDTADATINVPKRTINVTGTYQSVPATGVVEARLVDGQLSFYALTAEGEYVIGSPSDPKTLSPLFHHGWVRDDETGGYTTDLTFLTEANERYFNITRVNFDGWTSHVEEKAVAPGADKVYYNEHIEDKENFYFDEVFSTPTTAAVDAYGEYGLEKVMAIKSYYRSGEGTVYPEIMPEDYLELRVWDGVKVKSLEDLKPENAEYFDIVHREYTGTVSASSSRINEKDFKTVPISTDVTDIEGYVDPIQTFITQESLAIPAVTGDFNPSNYPDVENRNPFGTGFMKVLKKIGDQEVEYSANDFYQFVSPYVSVKGVAEAGSQKYSWIHWVTHKANEEVSEDKGVLLSRTFGCEISDVPLQLSEVENLVTIVPDKNFNGFIPLSEYQDYRDESKKVTPNTIVVANITEQKFGSDMYNNAVVSNGEPTSGDYSDEVLGIVPVLMGGFQALPRQSRIELPDGITNGHIFNSVEAVKRGSSIETDPAPAADHVVINAITLNGDGFVRTLGTTGEYDAFESTYSNEILATVPAIDLNANYKPNGSKMNYVTLAVCQLSLSKVNDNKVAMTVLETFTGSLDPTAKGEDNKSMFIDDIVNNEDTGSTYVRVFSNYQSRLGGSQLLTQSVRETVAPASNDTKATVAVPMSLGTELWWTGLKPSMSIGFTEKQTRKDISYATMVATIENVFDMLSNVDELDIDVVVDAGLSTIANRVKKHCDENPEETKMEYDVFYDPINSVEDVGGWKSMCAKLTTFCQTTRKDCIALLDAPRSLCVKDNVKLVRPGSGKSVDYDILPKFNYLGGMNSSYAAGYCDWLLAVDDFTSRNVWLPPSIAAEGAVIYTDYNSNYWMPPAGQTRGNVMWAVDVAFNPNSQQQDSIYSKGWNYALNSSGSIMVWGQKTMLNSTSSFNRINIRRLFCRLERLTRKNSKWVIFEINNRRTRDIYKDRIDPIFANVKSMGGIYDYQIICDERNNTPSVIQQNEFRSAFLIKPEYAAEFIVLTFFNMNQDMDFSEAYSQL